METSNNLQADRIAYLLMIDGQHFTLNGQTFRLVYCDDFWYIVSKFDPICAGIYNPFYKTENLDLALDYFERMESIEFRGL